MTEADRDHQPSAHPPTKIAQLESDDVSSPPFVFRTEQFIAQPLPEVFHFFSQAENLQRITPDWLHFRILSVDPAPIQQGTLIRYALRWRVFPIRWTTQIILWEPPIRFIDLQLKGPYRLWRHEHRFVAENRGTRIIDEVRYRLPFGVIGRMANSLKVRKDVEAIFAYRRAAVASYFESSRSPVLTE